MSTVRPDAAGLDRAVAALRRGAPIGMPTETVYGLAARLDPSAVQRIFATKGRPADNPLIVHLASDRDLAEVVAAVTPLAAALAERFWPGPLTLVLQAHDRIPRVVTGGLDTVAVRVPDHPVATALLDAIGEPLAAPSANRSGRPSPTRAAHVVAEFGDALELVVDGGPCAVGVESTVVDARGEVPVVLRAGSITDADLIEVAGAVARAGSPQDTLASPGTRYRHYAPRCAVRLAAPGEGPAVAAGLAASGTQVGLVVATGTATADRDAGEAPVPVLLRFADAAELAQRLYATLRDAEDRHLDTLVVESVDDVGIGRAVMDRLRRSAGLD